MARTLPQTGQGVSRVQLGDRVEAGREVLGGRPLTVSILLITSCETWASAARSFWDRFAPVRFAVLLTMWPDMTRFKDKIVTDQ
jgi:hypothetical protein